MAQTFSPKGSQYNPLFRMYATVELEADPWAVRPELRLSVSMDGQNQPQVNYNLILSMQELSLPAVAPYLLEKLTHELTRFFETQGKNLARREQKIREEKANFNALFKPTNELPETSYD